MITRTSRLGYLLIASFALACQLFTTKPGTADELRDALAVAKQAAEQGDASAQVNLGLFYHNGMGVPQNDVEAAKWFRRAADQGNADAQYKLADAYEHGRGVPRDYAEAAKWYRSAAERGHALASINLGEMYAHGHGVKRDFAEAARWYRLAADSGDAFAQYWLGAQYLYGGNPAIPRDYMQAHMWSNLSAATNPTPEDAVSHFRDDARRNRDIAATKMTPSKIAEAQALALAWKPQNRP